MALLIPDILCVRRSHSRNIEIMERLDIFQAVTRKTETFQQRLRSFNSLPLVGEARGIGLIGAIELVKDKASKESFPARCKSWSILHGTVYAARTRRPSTRRCSVFLSSARYHGRTNRRVVQ